jgi:hypothetical protein
VTFSYLRLLSLWSSVELIAAMSSLSRYINPRLDPRFYSHAGESAGREQKCGGEKVEDPGGAGSQWRADFCR